MNIKITLSILMLLVILVYAFLVYRKSVHTKFSNAAYHAILGEGLTVSDCRTEIKPLYKYTIYKTQAVFCTAAIEQTGGLLEARIKHDKRYFLIMK